MMNFTNGTITSDPLNIPYTVCEVLVAIMAVIGNAMVIIVFRKERRLRRRTNYYIISLATADFLVGLLGIPFAILASVGLPTNLHACLFTVSLLVVLCTISIFCLVAVSVDRYWAILHPMGYSTNVRTKTALVIISICWMAGTFIGFLPLLGWHRGKTEDQKCFFVGVMDYNYLVFLYFATIITPSLLLAAFYAHIYRVVLKQLRQIVTMNPGGYRPNGHIRANGGTMLRMLGAAQKREVKATQNLSIIVLFFMICWIPLYTINCVQAFCADCVIDSTLTYFCIILSHLNSAGNPLLYAYHLRDFRAALKNYILALFGVREKKSNYMTSCRASLASNNLSHRLNYLRNPYTGSPRPVTPGYRCKYTETPTRRDKFAVDGHVPICVPIVTTTTAVAVASAGGPNREMWMIKELPSTSVSENNLEREGIFPADTLIAKDMTSDSSSSGKINSGYIEGPIDDLEIGDDEVFYADASTFSANCYDSDSEIIKSNDSPIEIVQCRPSKKTCVNQTYKQCLSNSSPQLSRSLFLVEAEMCNGTRKSSVSLAASKALKLNSFELCKGKFKPSCAGATQSTSRDLSTFEAEMRSNGASVARATSGDFSPAKSLKLSPFKAVGGFLLQHTSKYSKSMNKIEEVSYRDLSIVPYDANRNGTIKTIDS